MDSRDRGGLAWAGYAAGVLVLWLTISGLLAPIGALGALAAFATALGVQALPTERSVSVLVVGGLGCAIGLLLGLVTTPLSGVALPDIGVFGRYTYLVTEVVFGTLAVGLLVRAGGGAIRRAVRTILVVYPLAYVWDWYTLEVGVFEIPLRTGVVLVGIPLEEHLFMVVVPALVLGVHELLDVRSTQG